jgi:hypothetical protein
MAFQTAVTVLTQVCRQVRKEFRPIYLQAPVAVQACNIEPYAVAFSPSKTEGQNARDQQHYPVHIFLLAVDQWLGYGDKMELQPFLKMKIASPEAIFTVVSDRGVSSLSQARQQSCSVISQILNTPSNGLRQDAASTKLIEIFYRDDDSIFIWYRAGQRPFGVDLEMKSKDDCFDDFERMLELDYNKVKVFMMFQGTDMPRFGSSSAYETEEQKQARESW